MSDDNNDTRRELLESDIAYYTSMATPIASNANGVDNATATADPSSNSPAADADAIPLEGSSNSRKEEPSSVVLDPVASTVVKDEDEIKPMITSDSSDDGDDEKYKPVAKAKIEPDAKEEDEVEPVIPAKSTKKKKRGLKRNNKAMSDIDDEKEEEDDDDDLPEKDLWELKRKVDKAGTDTYYREAHVHRKDGTREKYKLGDVAWMEVDGDIWVGLILDFYSKKSTLYVVLRWFYNEDHLKDVKNLKIGNEVRQPFLKHELIFSDDLEFEPNEVNVIEGKVYLFQTRAEYDEFDLEADVDHDEDEELYYGKRKNDKKYIVRNFFNPEHPARVRQLEPGELRYLLHHPEVKPMWSRFAKAGSARNAVSGKGTGGRNSFQPTSKIRKSKTKQVRKGRKKLRKMPESLEVDEEEAPIRERDGTRQLTIKEFMLKRG